MPARRAFLKGARTERAAIVEVVSHLAVSHPGVGFRLSESDRDLLSLPPAKDLRERLAQIYGVGKARAFRRVEHEADPFRVRGYVALPSLTYTNRSSCQTISVNGRWVRAEVLSRALDDAYRATMPAGRYPPVALEVEVDPRKVDVNVHPTKQVVRFSEERQVRKAVADAVKVAIEWGGQRPYGSGPSTDSSTGSATAGSPPDAAAVPAERGQAQVRKGGVREGREEGRLFERHTPRPSARELDNAA